MAVSWYFAHVREGREEAVARRCLRLVDRKVLADCFAPKIVRLLKRSGEWRREQRLLYPGYLLMLTPDVAALRQELGRLSVRAELVGAAQGECAPLAPGTRMLLEGVLDEGHVLQPSTGVIERGQLKVGRGPLVGHEARVRRIDRHKCLAWLDADAPGGGSLMLATLEITEKS